jgi:hypothetical protein
VSKEAEERVRRFEAATGFQQSERIGSGSLMRKVRHHCQVPCIVQHGIQTGDEWTCDCGRAYVAAYHDDPRPGEGGPYWKYSGGR